MCMLAGTQWTSPLCRINSFPKLYFSLPSGQRPHGDSVHLPLWSPQALGANSSVIHISLKHQDNTNGTTQLMVYELFVTFDWTTQQSWYLNSVKALGILTMNWVMNMNIMMCNWGGTQQIANKQLSYNQCFFSWEFLTNAKEGFFPQWDCLTIFNFRNINSWPYEH